MSVPIYSPHQSFYVPEFQVRVGEDTPGHAVPEDILSVSCNDDIGGIDQLEITLSNWDAQRQTFKYEPPLEKDKYLFAPDDRIHLYMGYGTNLRRMSSGIVTTIEPNYPESGGPTLTIRAQQILHLSQRRQYTKSWDKMRDSEIAKELGTNAAGGDQPGLGMQVVIDASAMSREPREPIQMQSQSVLDFLRERAKRRGYVFYVDQSDDGKDRLYFGPSDRPGRTEYDLSWGTSLISFRPTLGAAHTAERVTVRGFDRKAGKKVEASAAYPADCDLNDDMPPPKGSHEIITNPPAQSQDQAQQTAREKLFEFRRTMIEASGATVGLPDLRAGSYVAITLEGSRFNGRYFVTSTSHSIASGGYTTSFKARRERALPKKA